MAAISRVFTIARVAEMLREGEDWLREISIEMEPEDGIGDHDTPAFTDFGIDNLQALVQIRKGNTAPRRANPAAKSPMRS